MPDLDLDPSWFAVANHNYATDPTGGRFRA